MVTSDSSAAHPEEISRAILVLRGQRVILDRDLAALYGVTTKRFNEAVAQCGKVPRGLHVSDLGGGSLGFEVAICDLKDTSQGGARRHTLSTLSFQCVPRSVQDARATAVSRLSRPRGTR